MSNFNSSSNIASAQRRLDEIFPLQKIIVCIFLLAVCCVYLPCAALCVGYTEAPLHFFIPAYIIVAAGIAFLFIMVKKLLYAISCTVIIVSLYYLTFSPILPAAVAAIVLIFTIGAYLSSICSKRLYPWLILLPIVSYIGAFGMTGNWAVSLLAIVPLSASIIQGILQRKNSERKNIILVSSITFLALLAGVVALLLYINGKLSYAAIQADIDIIRNSLSDYLKNMSFELEGETFELATEDMAEYIDALILKTFNMLPALITVVTFAIVYLSHSLQFSMYQSTDYDLLITPKTAKISMSIYAASAFVLSYILSLSTDVAGRPDLLGVVAGNLCIILLPGLFIVGVDSFAIIVKKLRGFGFFAILLLLSAFLMLSSYALYIVAAIGAFYIIITSIDQWAKKHYSQNRS